MTCEEAIKLLAPYLGGKLEQEQAMEVRTHFRGCRSCPRVRTYGGFVVVEERPEPRKRIQPAADPVKQAV